MLNQIQTPQVILGINGSLFNEFEGRRKGTSAGAHTVSDWYDKAVDSGGIWLSTIENSDVMSFSLAFNSGEAGPNQSLFIVEVLDPTNSFEARFLSTFYDGAQSYLDVISKTFGQSIDFQHPETANQILEEMTGARRAPSLVPMMITFGVGNDARNWAPVQKASLVYIDYDLTDEGVRKFILKFVPSAGLERLLADESEKSSMIPTDWVKTVAEETLIDLPDPRNVPRGPGPYDNELSRNREPQEPPPHIDMGQFPLVWKGKNPLNVVFDLIRKGYENSIHGPVITFLDELRDPLQKMWTQSCMGAVDKYLLPLQQAALTRLPGGGELLDYRTERQAAARHLAETFTNEYEVPKTRHVTSFTGPVPVNAAALRESDLGDAEVVTRHLIRKGPFSGNPQVLRLQEKLFAQVTADHRAHWDSYQESRTYPHEWLRAPYPITQAPPLLKQLRDAWMTAKDNSWSTAWLPENLFDPVFKRMANLTGGLHSLEKKKYFEAKAGAPIEDVTFITGIQLTTQSQYTIYVWAAMDFFERLGFTITHSWLKDPQTAGPAAPGIDPSVTQRGTGGENSGVSPKRLMEAYLNSNDIKVSLIADSPRKLRETLGNILKSLGQNSQVDPYVTCFSELSLINMCKEKVNDPTIIPDDATEILFIASYDAMGILIGGGGPTFGIGGESLNNVERIPVKRSELFWAITAAFQEFRVSEPPLSDFFGTMFANPDLSSTFLPSEGDANALNLHFSQSTIERYELQTNEDINRFLSDFQIPVFNYGFKNSNVLDFNFQLRPWYGYLLDVVPQIAMTGLMSQTIENLPLTDTLLGLWRGQKTASDKIQAIADYYDDYLAGGDLQYPGDYLSPEDLNPQLTFEETLARSKAQILSIGAEWFKEHGRGEGAIATEDVQYGSRRDLFIKTMVRYIMQLESNFSPGNILMVNPENKDEVTDTLLSMRSKLANRTFVGQLKTLPLFSLLSGAKTLGKSALLYFIEPEVMSSHGFKGKEARSTWLSGEYYIVGYEVKINPSQVTTSFNIIKKADDGSDVRNLGDTKVTENRARMIESLK